MVRTLKHGRYRLDRPLGGGGQGTVHVATDRIDGRSVVLKWSPDRDADTTDVEHALLAGLDHPAVVPLLGAFQEPSVGGRVLVEPLVEGAHLDEAGLDAGELLETAVRLVDALSFLHRRGVRHGDVKPANVLVTRTPAGPRPVVIDFGLATSVDDPVLAGGTPAFLAPEIGRGEPPSAATDWWALGVSLRRATESLDAARGAVDRLGPLLDALLTADPRRRVQRLGEVLEILRVDPLTVVPRRLPTMASPAARHEALERTLRLGEINGEVRLAIGGDDEAGRGALLDALRLDLLRAGRAVVVRRTSFSLDGVVAEILNERGRHLDAPQRPGRDPFYDIGRDRGRPPVVLLHDAASRSSAARALAVGLEAREGVAPPPFVLVTASPAPQGRAVALGSLRDEDVEHVLCEVLAVTRDDGARAAAAVVADTGGRRTGGVTRVIRRGVAERRMAVRDGTLIFDAGAVARAGAGAEDAELDADARAVLAALGANGGALDEEALIEVTGLGAGRVQRAVAACAAAGVVLAGAERDCPVILESASADAAGAAPGWSLLDDEPALARRLETWLDSVFPEAAARTVTHLVGARGGAGLPLFTAAVRGLLRANRPEEARRLLHSAPDEDDTTLLAARCDMILGRPDRARRLLLARRPRATRRGGALIEARTAHAELLDGCRDEALRRMESLFEADVAEAAVEALTLSAVAISEERPDEARRRFERALERVAPDDHGRAGACLSNFGAFERRAGHLGRALELLSQATSRLARHGDAAQTASALTNLGAALSESGRFRDAITTHGRALAGFEHAGDRVRAATVRASIGITRYRAGFLSAARRDLAASHRTAAIDESSRERVREEFDALDTLLGRFGAVRRRGGRTLDRLTAARTRCEQASRRDLVRLARSQHVEERLVSRAAMTCAVRGGCGARRRLRRVLELVDHLESGMTRRQRVAFRAATVIPLYEELVERLEHSVAPAIEQAPLLGVLRGVTDAVGREEALGAVVAGALEATRAVRAFVLRRAAGRIEILASDFDSERRGDSPVSTHAVERAVVTERAVFITDAATDADLGFAPSVQRHGLHSIACIPLHPADPEAVLYLDSPVEEGAFDSDESRAAAEALGRAAAFSVSLFDRAARGREEAQESSRELRSRTAELSRLRSRLGEGSIPGRSPAIVALNDLVDRIAPTDLPVLICGETGSGKELAAQALHAHSDRREAPFIPVNCAALPAGLAESELFGHVRGAFSGAGADEPGLLRLADGGTIFLDEVGDMPPDLQPKLLRALESGQVRPVGGHETYDVDVRIVSATLQDPGRRLRDDLYFRLAGVTLDVPPLRERKEDVAYLTRRFLREAGCDKPLEPAALEALETFDWPGNVRQLRNAIERVAVLSVQDEIRLTDLPADIVGFLGQTPRALEEIEREALDRTLRYTAGDKKRAAAILGISRTTLYNKLKRFGM